MFEIFKKSVKSLDELREMTENRIAKSLRKIQGNQRIDFVEILISTAVMEAVESYTGKEIPIAVKTKINEGVVKGCDKASELVVAQLER